MVDRLPVHNLDPTGATDQQAVIYDAAVGKVVFADQVSGGVSGTFIGAHLTSLVNATVLNEVPLEFDTANGDSGGFWDISDPDKIVIPAGRSGWYLVGADITTLGSSYSGPSNDNVVMAVLKNWDGVSTQLGYYCAFERFNNENGAAAHGNSLAQPVHLTEGDVLQLILIGPTGSGLLVESNPSDGLPSGFPTDTGPGTLSPHFFAIRFGPGLEGPPGDTGADGDPGVVQSIVEGAHVSVDDTDPANPIVAATGYVESIVQGTGITVDDTDPANPVISATGGGSATSGELLMADGVTAPPVPIETEAQDDWLYQD